jgi:microcystin degradation protein MlrC
VKTDTGLTVMLTSRRQPPFSLSQLTQLGLKPEAFRLIVAKGVHAPVAAYREVCKSFIRVNTPGVTAADMRQLTYRHRRKPMFPFETDTIWSPG